MKNSDDYVPIDTEPYKITQTPEEFSARVDEIRKVCDDFTAREHERLHPTPERPLVFLVDSVTGLMDPIDVKEAKRYMRRKDWHELKIGGIILIHC
jgi:hypothetical protein